MELDAHTKQVIKNKIKGSFAEFQYGNLVAEILTYGKELVITGIGRMDVSDTVNGMASYVFEQTDGTLIEVPPNYSMITFYLEETEK